MPTFFSSKDTHLGPSLALLTYFRKIVVATTDKAKCAASFEGRCAYKVKGVDPRRPFASLAPLFTCCTRSLQSPEHQRRLGRFQRKQGVSRFLVRGA